MRIFILQFMINLKFYEWFDASHATLLYEVDLLDCTVFVLFMDAYKKKKKKTKKAEDE